MALKVVEKRGKPHALWPTRPLPDHSFADCVLFAAKHAKDRVVVFVGLPTGIDVVLELSKLARFLIGAQIDELDLPANELCPGKILGNYENRVIDGIRPRATITAFEIHPEKAAFNN